MYLLKTLIISLFSLPFIAVKAQNDEIFSNLLDGGVKPMQNFKADFYYKENKIQALVPEKVEIKLFYECLCNGCRGFVTIRLHPTVEKLASNLNVHLYPYGNAETIDKGNGEYEIKCQHGPDECYGNKLHACAIEHLGNMTKAVFFNACMMDFSRKSGSDDKAADECGKTMNVDSEWIKQCAKGDKGAALLKYYGDESKKVGYDFVPYIMINGVQYSNGRDLMKDVCAVFKTPPPECAEVV